MAKMADLKVCTKCGWFEHGRYREQECDPSKGKEADRLASLVPEIPSTKLGYGDGRLTFELHEGLHVRLDCPGKGQRKTFGIEDVWILSDYPAEDVAELVRAIAGTKIGRGK